MAELFQTALKVAKEAVIFKRPYYVEVDPNCSVSFKSRSIHWDVYQVKRTESSPAK